jgi:hypothetical protein
MGNHLNLQLLKLRTELLLSRLGGRHARLVEASREYNPSGGGESVKFSDRI